MKKLVIEFSNERLITPSGLSLVGQMLGKSSFIKKCNNMKVDGKRSQSQIKNGDILLSYIGLLCQGKTSYDAIINSYHAHGECEQFHSKIKTDMDVERLPSGKFDTNELVLELTVLAYNILRLIGQESLKSKRAPKTKHPVRRRRIRTVIGNLIHIAGHITTHGRRIVLAIGCSNVWRHAFMDVYNRFAFA